MLNASQQNVDIFNNQNVILILKYFASYFLNMQRRMVVKKITFKGKRLIKECMYNTKIIHT
jgi:hypothetical protein